MQHVHKYELTRPANILLCQHNHSPHPSNIPQIITITSSHNGRVKSHRQYTDRHAVRTIVLSANKSKIALIFVQKGQYYKIPGGGIELDEDHGLAAEREAFEETGCKVKIQGACLATSGLSRSSLASDLDG